MRAGARLRAGAVLCVVVAMVAGLAVADPSVVQPEADGGDRTREEVRVVGVADHDARLWPYTSRQRDFGTVTLPINVVVEADADRVSRVMAAGSGRNWTVEDPEGEAVVVNGSGVTWADTRGATRYTYVETDRGGRWMDESEQLHDGAYLGSRIHVRLYEVEGEDGTLTAVQAHHEHWDWFRLRHTVGSVSRGQYAVEQEFYGTGLISDISRDRFGNGGILDADGWVTVVDLIERGGRSRGLVAGTLSLGLLGLGVRRNELTDAVRTVVERSETTGAHLAMFGVPLFTPVTVRVVTVELERTFPALSPKLFAVPGYLALAVGLPLVAGIVGRQLAADEAFVAAAVGLGAGFLLDYSVLGITTLPFGVVVHRAVLLIGLGLLAAGGVRWAARSLHRHHYRLAGAVVWVLGLLWPLAGL